MNDGEREGEQGKAADPATPDDTDQGALSSPAVDQASGVGLSMTLATGVLLAFAYYGTLAVADVGFGQAIPPPFYMLGLALVFVVELIRRPSYDVRELARVVGITAVFGTLIILAVEGAAYLWDRPEAALDEFSGVVVLAVSLVVAALAYVGYLSAVNRSERPR